VSKLEIQVKNLDGTVITYMYDPQHHKDVVRFYDDLEERDVIETWWPKVSPYADTQYVIARGRNGQCITNGLGQVQVFPSERRAQQFLGKMVDDGHDMSAWDTQAVESHPL
jgi:hypothetical protein